MMLSLSSLTRKDKMFVLNLSSITTMLVYVYIEFFFNSGLSHLYLYNNIILDRTTTFDHILSVIALLGFFVITLFKTRVPIKALAITMIVFGLANNYADNFILHAHNLYFWDYILPALGISIMLYLGQRKMIPRIMIFYFSLLPIYLFWVIAKIPIDCFILNAKYNAWNFCPLQPYFMNLTVNSWIILVWYAVFTLGYIILVSDYKYSIPYPKRR